MDCNEVRRFLDAYVDGEIELTRQVDVEAHLVRCSDCKKAVEAATKFRHSIKMNTLVYKAPPELEAEVRAALRKVSKSQIRWISELCRPLLYAAAILIVCLLCVAAWIATSENEERVLIAQAISNHSHSLLADHLLDVAASDRHVLNTWFTGNLDYSPPIADLPESGYKLIGGRLDMLENHPVAAIVYSHRDHVINEFVWPTAPDTIDFDVQSHQGYSMCAWNKSGFNYLIVADLSQADMETFEDQIRERTE
jgi:anti-sigma factor RsiW